MIDFDELEDFLDYLDREEYVNLPKRYLRDGSNPFEYFYEEAFGCRFRFSKECIMYRLLPIIEEDLQKVNNRGLPVSPVLQLLMGLRFYASGSYQVSLIYILFMLFDPKK